VSRTRCKQSSHRRRPVDRALPPAVRAQVNQAILAEPEPTGEAVARIHESFNLESAHNVTLRQFRGYAVKLLKQRSAPTGGTSEYPAEHDPETEAFRARMRRRGEVLAAMARALADYDPVQWGRGVYFTMLGRVFDALEGRDVGIPIDVLNTLSKIITEQRRAEAQATQAQRPVAGAGDRVEPDSPGTVRTLPENFGEIVRRIYGTNFQADVREPKAAASSRSADEKQDGEVGS
jgi:hypothetical protein